MSDETHKSAEAVQMAKSLWVVTAGSEIKAVKLRAGRSVKDAVAAAAQVLKKRYPTQRSLSEVRAGRIGK